MSMPLLARSYLFVPASRPDRIAKAQRSGAHAVVVDLEDGVAPEAREQARESVAAALDPKQPALLRINPAGSAFFSGDLALCSHPGVAGVMLAKAESADEVRALAQHCPPGMPILPLIESARGMDNARTIAQSPGVVRLAFGTLDFQLDTGIEGGDLELASFRNHLVVVSRLAGIQSPVDGITAHIEADDLLRADAQRARRFGFGAKLCIHPRQVAIVNECFLPTAAELGWARKVLAAAESARGAAVDVDGEMIDQPAILRARRILSEAGF